MTEPGLTTTASRRATGIVRGTMQPPWSDHAGPLFPAGGPLLDDLAARLGLGTADRVLVLGPHSAGLIRTVAAATASRPTVVVRGVEDAQELADSGVPATIVAGSLDGFADSEPGAFTVVVALDGLDRVLSYDSRPLSFEDTLRLVVRLADEDGARMAIGHSFLTAPVNVLDARVESDRYGDADFRPFHSDPTRPATLDALAALVERVVGRPPEGLVALFGPAQAPRLAVSNAPAALVAAPAGLTSYAVQAAHAHRRPLLARPDELIRTLAGAGRLADAADGGIVLCGARANFDLARLSPGGLLVVAEKLAAPDDFATITAVDAVDVGSPDDTAHEVTASDTAQPSEIVRYLHPQTSSPRGVDAGIRNEPLLVPSRFHLTPTVEDEFVRLAALGDVPGFRRLAQDVGRYAESVPVTDRRVLTFDDLHVCGRGFTPGTDGSHWDETVATADGIAAAFWLLSDRLRTEHRPQPWPDHVQGEPLVGMWVEMAGHEADGASIAGARRLADSVARSRPRLAGTVPDLRTAFADAGQARKELAQAQGHIVGLERTLGFRDKQLRTQEQVIRQLRGSGQAGGVAAVQSHTSTAARMIRRTSQVRSVGELTAGVDRVIKRTRRNRASRNRR